MNGEASIKGTHLDVRIFMISAFRYALGRRTYFVKTVADMLLKNVELLSPGDRETIIGEINKAYSNYMIGGKMDKEVWFNLRDELKRTLED